MNKDSQIYNSIGQILFDTAPEGAKKIRMRAAVSLDNDCLRSQYINETTGETYFLNKVGAASDILNYLVELKYFYIENNLTNDQPIWHGCEVTLDIENGKINFDFKYEPMFDE